MSLLNRIFRLCLSKGTALRASYHGHFQAACQEGNFNLTNQNNNNNNINNNNNNNKSIQIFQCQMLLLLQKYLRRAAFQLFPLANFQPTPSFLIFLSELESLLKPHSLTAFGGFCSGNTPMPGTTKISSFFIFLWLLRQASRFSKSTAVQIGEFQLEMHLGMYLYTTLELHLYICSLV